MTYRRTSNGAYKNIQAKNSHVTVTRADGTVVIQQNPYRRKAIPRSLVIKVFQRDGLCCRYCGYKSDDPKRFHIDHVKPASLGGCDELENLVVSCRRCNLRKKNRVWVPLSIERAQSLTRPLVNRGA